MVIRMIFDALTTHLENTFVASGYDFHASQAIFFPRPQKDETVSHPVDANQKSSPEQTPSRILAE